MSEYQFLEVEEVELEVGALVRGRISGRPAIGRVSKIAWWVYLLLLFPSSWIRPAWVVAGIDVDHEWQEEETLP